MARNLRIYSLFNFIKYRGILSSSSSYHTNKYFVTLNSKNKSQKSITKANEGNYKYLCSMSNNGTGSNTGGILDHSDSENDEEIDFYDRESFRETLYPNTNDPLMLQLNESQSVQDVFNFINKNQSNLNSKHLSQAVLILWDLQRIYWHMCVDTNPVDSLSDLNSYLKAVTGHPDFYNLLRLLQHCYQELTPNALTCTLLYLMKMGVDIKHPTVEKILENCVKNVNSYPLTAVSRYLVAIQGRNLWTIAMSQSLVPLIFKTIETCNDPDDFRLVTISLAHLSHFVTSEILEMFKNRVKYLLDQNIIGRNHPRTIVKILTVLNFPRWSKSNCELIRELMLTLSGLVPELKLNDVIALHRVFQTQLEPVNIVNEIQEYVLQLLQERKEFLSLPIDVFECVVPFSSQKLQNNVFEDLLVSHIKSQSFSVTMPIVFRILRYLKTSNHDLCNLFWREAVKQLKYSGPDDFTVLGVCHKYMHFNNNLGGTLRNYELESQLSEYLTTYLHQLPGRIPTKLARIAAFLISYSPSYAPPALVNKIEEMAPQFSILDCLIISRGLQVATEFKSRNRGSLFLNQLVTVSSVISSCVRQFLLDENLRSSDVNMLMRIYINMKGVCGTDLHEHIMERYQNIEFMSSRILRETCYNLTPHRCLILPIMELISNYVTHHAHYMLGDTIEKFLTFSYFTGYVPHNPKFFQAASSAIERDREKLNGLSLLQAALSLCYFQHLPLNLINSIFSIEFLESIDDELKFCYSKATYPGRVRHCLMELNRAVCIDYPQANIPWFHAKYCEEQATLDTVPTTNFHKEVFRTLSNVVGGSEYVKSLSYTPYYYKLDFEIVLDEKQRPIPVKKLRDIADRQVTRVGVLLLREDSFTTGSVQLRGPQLLRRRHLEMLNYRQIEISQNLWRAMYMSEESDRQAYITKYMWPASNKHTEENAIDTDSHLPAL